MGAPLVTRYAKTADGVNIAYQVVSDNGPDLLMSQGFISNVELAWEYPPAAEYLARLARFSRLVLFDKRGVGLSDRGVGFPTIEERTDDITAVLAAAGSESVHLLGESEGGPTCLQYAAMRPERVSSLVIYGSFARMLVDDDYPIGIAPDVVEAVAVACEETWGRPEAAEIYRLWEPDVTLDDEAVEQLVRWHRRSASPREAGDALRRVGTVDVRSVLGSISVPTLVLHRSGDVVCPVGMGAYLADRIPSARLVELPGDEHTMYAGDHELLATHIEEWVTGRPAATPDLDAERVLATVLFTDIVGSTASAADLGDRAWTQLLDVHDRTAGAVITQFRGRRVKSTGDGVLATFDGPGRAVRCAHALVDAIRSLGVEIRAGLHVGEIELRGDDIGGIGVHIGSRVCSRSGPGEVWVTSTVRDLVTGSDLEFRDLGPHELKGVPGTWQLLSSVAP